MQQFTNKVALITGGSRGIGAATAIELAKEGCNLVLNYNSKKDTALQLADELKKNKIEIDLIQGDVSKIKDLEKIFKFIEDKYNSLDILINSAGICQIINYDKITENDWDTMMNVNLKGTYFSCQFAIELMKKKQQGKIVNVASTAGLMGGFIVGVNYSVSKAGVVCLTKALSKVAIKHGINVNCVAPGLIETDMSNDFPPDLVNSMKNGIPIQRLGTAKEIADSIVFLASEKSNYFVGSTLLINGGTYQN